MTMTEFDYIRKFEDVPGESPIGLSADVHMDCAFVGFSNGDGDDGQGQAPKGEGS